MLRGRPSGRSSRRAPVWRNRPAPSRLVVTEAHPIAPFDPPRHRGAPMPTQTYTDAIALLKADHRKVEDLFEKFEKARDGAKQKLALEICNELKIHTIIEEEVFYPALKGKIEEDTWTE